MNPSVRDQRPAAGAAAWLEADADSVGVMLSAAQVDALLTYMVALRQWNERINLTAVSAQESLRRHLVDCLAVLPSLRRHTDQLGGSLPPRLLDAGSGGGLPGIVIAIVEPDWQVRCIDSVTKKVAFIQDVAGRLGLRNLRGVHDRLSDDDFAGSSEQVDVVVSRAFASLTRILDLTGPRLRAGGWWMTMQGEAPTAVEVAHVGRRTEEFHVEQLHVPDAAHRCLVWMRKPSIADNRAS